MMIVLHKHVPERNQHRFYALQLAPNLFGAWSLIRIWGRLGASGQQRRGYASPLRTRLTPATRHRRGISGLTDDFTCVYRQLP